MTNNLKYDPQALSIALKQLPYGRHGNFRDAARNLDVSKNTIQQTMENRTIVHYSSSLKPALTEQKSYIAICSVLMRTYLMVSSRTCMLHRVHLDEKCFFVIWKQKRFYWQQMKTCHTGPPNTSHIWIR